MHKSKGTAAASNAIDLLEGRVLLSSYTPAVLYTFASSPDVHSMFANADGSVTYVDDGGVSTEPAGGGTPTQAAAFSVDGINSPGGLAFENSAGDIFGSSNSGGTDAQPSGAVWEAAKGSSSMTLLASFDPAVEGSEPAASYMDSSGNIYGYTNFGANGAGAGSLWEYHAGTQQITSVAIPSTYGPVEGALFADSAGNLFGATAGSTSSPGVFFELAAGGSTVSTVASFSSSEQGSIGYLTSDAAGNVFGICRASTGDEIYEVSAANRSAITPLASVAASSGILTIDSAGDVFTVGSTINGGLTDSLYELHVGQHATVKIATLVAGAEGDDTFALAVNNSTGVIYGATEDGGSSSSGALYSLTPSSGGGGSSGSASLGITIARSTLPASVVAGGTSRGEAIVDVTNNGGTTYSGTDTVDVYASTDGSVDGSSTLIGTVTRRVGIRAGRVAPVVVPIRSLPATLDGSYTLLAQVTDTAGNSATSATGPSLTAAAPFISFSDTIIRTTLAPSDVTGQKTRASVQLKITNGGNIVSSGESTIALYASVDTTPTDGTLIRSVAERVVLKPGAARVVTIPLLSLPVVPNNAYFVDAQVTDPRANVTTAATAGTYALAAPFDSLVPSAAAVTVAKNGTATVSFIVTNNGNIVPTGLSTVTIYASSNGSTVGATAAFTQRVNLALPVGRARVVRVRLTAAEVTTLQAATTPILAVTDPLGGVQTLTLTV